MKRSLQPKRGGGDGGMTVLLYLERHCPGTTESGRGTMSLMKKVCIILLAAVVGVVQASEEGGCPLPLSLANVSVILRHQTRRVGGRIAPPASYATSHAGPRPAVPGSPEGLRSTPFLPRR